MKKAALARDESTDQGTFGTLLTADGKVRLHSLELPWRDVNKDGIGDPQKSCITPGVYILRWHKSPSRGWVYEVTGVKGRSHILVHSANYAGDVDKGWQSELLGCIALGLNRGRLRNKFGQLQGVVSGSRDACKRFFEWGAEQDVELTITGGKP